MLLRVGTVVTLSQNAISRITEVERAYMQGRTGYELQALPGIIVKVNQEQVKPYVVRWHSYTETIAIAPANLIPASMPYSYPPQGFLHL